MAALESKLTAKMEDEKAAAAERRLESLAQLLHQAVILRRALVDAGIVAAAEGAQAAEEETCWAGAGTTEEVLMGEGEIGDDGEEQVTEEVLLLKARAR